MNHVKSAPALPPRPADGHKGLFGRVLVVGGQEAMIGAPVMSGTAALLMGSGLVQIAMPRALLPIAISITPELIGLPLKRSGGINELRDAAAKATVIVIGPGMGQSAETERRLLRLIRLEKPMVIDADALNLLAARKRWPRDFKASAVLTPHPGEMQRLRRLIGKGSTPPMPTDTEGRIKLATQAAAAFGQIIVLKGHETVVADGKDRIYINHTGNSSLSKAGTGDVLSGMIASLIGQKMEPFDAACLGVHLHGRAGEIAGERLGMRSVLAMDVLETIPDAIADHEERGDADAGREPASVESSNRC